MKTPIRAACLLAGLTIVAATVAIPATASASTGTITVGTAGSPPTNVGLLSIQVSATTPITSISAQIMSGSTDELDVSDFTLTAGTTTDGTWTVQNAITEQQLALGGYTVDVSATDAGGDSVTGQQAPGDLAFVVIPTITLSADHTVITYDNQSITFSGTVTGTWPDGSTQPLADWPVEMLATEAWTANLTTGSDGSFQETVAQPEIGSSYFATTNWTSTTAGGTSNVLDITATQDAVDLTATLSPTHTDYGKPVTISGTATYQSGSAWKPLSDSTIDVYGGPPAESGFVPLATTTTGADGSYTLTIPADGSGTLTVYAGGLPDDYYPDQLLAQATQNVTLTVKYQVSLTKFTASLSTLGVLSVSSCLSVAPSDFPPLLPAQIQYAPSPGGPWKTLHTTHRALNDEICGNSKAYGETFSAQADVVAASAYYRLYYPGSSTYLPASTRSLHRWKYLTKITDFKVSPHRVAKGGKITVSGQLREYVHRWKDLAWQRVLIVLRPKGSKTWYWIYKVKTGKTGRFTKTFTDPVSATWSADYLGGSTHFASGAIRVYVSRSGPASAAWLPAQLRVVPSQADELAGLGDVMP